MSLEIMNKKMQIIKKIVKIITNYKMHKKLIYNKIMKNKIMRSIHQAKIKMMNKKKINK